MCKRLRCFVWWTSGTDWHRLEVLAPRNSELADYDIRLSEVINTLSQIYKAPAELIINQIRNRDTLSVEIDGAAGGSIQAGALIHVITGLCDLIGYAGALESESRPYVFRKPQRHSQIVKNLEVGPMFRGSFGLLIEMPLSGPALITETQPPVFRRAAVRLMRGLNALGELADGVNTDTFVEAATAGFNGNMCRVFADLLGSLGGRESEYTMAWSPYWPVPPELQRLRTVRMGPENRDLLISAARKLEFVEPRSFAAGADALSIEEGPTTIIGLVTHLHSEREARGDSREIVIKGGDTRERVHVEMTERSYKMACDAHRDGRLVRAEGTLKRSRGVLVLSGVRSITIE